MRASTPAGESADQTSCTTAEPPRESTPLHVEMDRAIVRSTCRAQSFPRPCRAQSFPRRFFISWRVNCGLARIPFFERNDRHRKNAPASPMTPDTAVA